MTTTQGCKEAKRRRRLMEELGHKHEKILLYYDSHSVLYIVRNPTFYLKTKHINIQYYFVREMIKDGSVGFQKIYIKKNLINI